MERVAIEIGVIIIIYLIGYRMGFRACYDYLMEELKSHKNNNL
jgi:hypothetical protein